VLSIKSIVRCSELVMVESRKKARDAHDARRR
jgi:hypothetical protein